MAEQNLFRSLFSYRPRHRMNPSENFLTEGFAYVLASNETLLEKWCENVCHGVDVKIGGPPQVTTQSSYELGEESAGNFARPDMEITFEDGRLGQGRLIFEHKWGAETDKTQLRNYLTLLRKDAKIERLVFIAPTIAQCKEAASVDGAIETKLWSDVHRFLKQFLDEHNCTNPMLAEFLRFMEDSGLGPAASFRKDELEWYVREGGVVHKCTQAAESLLHVSRDWSFLPMRFREPGNMHVAKYRWGRIGIEAGEAWRPNVFIGFLLNNSEHNLTLVAPQESIDLVLFIESDTPSESFRSPEAVNECCERLRTVTSECRIRITTPKNDWRKLTVQTPLVDIIKDSHQAEQQAEAIHECVSSWCRCLFSDGKLEAAIEATWPAGINASSGGVVSREE